MTDTSSTGQHRDTQPNATPVKAWLPHGVTPAPNPSGGRHRVTSETRRWDSAARLVDAREQYLAADRDR